MPLRKQLEAQESHSRLHEEMAEYWRTRWHHVAVALKFKEEELQRLQRQSGTWPPQVGTLCLSPSSPPPTTLFSPLSSPLPSLSHTKQLISYPLVILPSHFLALPHHASSFSIHVFSMHLLSICYMPGPLLCAEAMSNQITPCPQQLMVWGHPVIEQAIIYYWLIYN